MGVNGATRVFFKHADEAGVSVNHVPCYLRIALETSDGGETWHLPYYKGTQNENWSELSLTRINAFKNGRWDDSTSGSARRKALETCHAALRVALEQSPSLLAQGEDNKRYNEIQRLSAAAATKEEELADLRAQIRALEQSEEVRLLLT